MSYSPQARPAGSRRQEKAGPLAFQRFSAALLCLPLIAAIVACTRDRPESAAGGAPDCEADGREFFSIIRQEQVIPSCFLEEGILGRPGIFDPGEAERFVLPFMAENAERFAGRRVLEIGTGSGVIGLYAARLGASAVVATDIDPLAIEVARLNAERLGVASVMDVRLVPPEDLSAYSVIRPEEKFDVIISNPPYSLDYAAEENSPVVDRGDLGLSIILGLHDQ